MKVTLVREPPIKIPVRTVVLELSVEELKALTDVVGCSSYQNSALYEQLRDTCRSAEL